MEKKTAQEEKKNYKILHWQVIAIYLMAFDGFTVIFSYYFALLIRFDFRYSSIPIDYLSAWRTFSPFYALICYVIFFLFKLYYSIWRFASHDELNRVILANLLALVINVVGTILFVRRMPISYYIIGSIVQTFLMISVRFGYRFISLIRSREKKKTQAKYRAMIIGAGESSHYLIRDLNNSKEINVYPVCVIDDNPNKRGRMIEGVPVVGDRTDILSASKKYEIDEIIYSIPSSSPEQQRDILNICNETGCKLLIVPGIYQFVTGEVTAGKMRPVAVEDLLGRPPIKVDMEEIFQQLQGMVILVTGGGGSIGSELCRQIARHNPKQLIIFDIYENNAYQIQQELIRIYPDLNLVVLIGSVRDSRRIENVIKHYHPDFVFHAAAHKHVPLMEESPNEAIKNNVVGTYKTAYALHCQDICYTFEIEK